MNKPVVYVLAAGEASRFGSPKQIAKVGEVSLLQFVLNRLPSQCTDVTAMLGAHAETVRDTLHSDVKTIVVDDYQLGISATLHAVYRDVCGLQPLGAPALMLVLGDTPYLQSDDYEVLLNVWYRNPDSIVAAQYDGHLMPPVIIPSALIGILMQCHGDSGLGRILRQRQDVIGVPTSSAALDIDTQTQLQVFLDDNIVPNDIS